MKFSLVVLLLAIAGCSVTKTVNTVKAPGVDFTSFKTFDYFKLQASGDTVSSRFDNYANMIREAITREMIAKGYTQSSADPDLLINIGAVVKEQAQTRETNIRDAPRYTGQRNYSWKSEEVVVGHYKTGTVTIELVDRLKNSMVWQGVVEGLVADKPKTFQSDINKAITGVFQKFPG